MADYDFTSLSPHDFEEMCRDLLQEELSVRLQSYKLGRDSGIDLRHAYCDGNELIIQCKHFARSNFATLYANLRNHEVPKVRSLAPKRYLLVTSLGLTPSNVDRIRALFDPYCRSTDDIIGRNDLNNLLRRHPTVERQNFKLWLTSQTVLERVVHSAVFVRSDLDEQEIRRKMAIYVESGAVAKAHTILDERHCCIISGIPGIGKTTLAQILLVGFLTNGWELISIEQGIEEALKVFKPSPQVKQLFYYDDFLGQITLGEKLQKNEDRRIVQLMQTVAKADNKRFILTTREYILAQARSQYEVLSRADLSVNTCILELEDYSTLDKAKILANHLYFSDVPQEHIDAILRDRRYRQIIQHRNYNPRLVEWITDKLQISRIAPQDYFDVFMSTLANPVRIWQHAFEHQIRESSRNLLLVLGSLGRRCGLVELESAFSSFYSFRASKFNFTTTPLDLRRSLEELEGTFIRISRDSTGPVLAFHNPSIMDFIARHCADTLGDVDDLLRSCVFFEQIEQVVALLEANLKGHKVDQRLRDHSESIQHAIENTVWSKCCKSVYPVASDPGNDFYHVSEHRSSISRRLRVVVKLASRLASRAIQRFVVEQIEAVMRDLGDSGDWNSDVVTLLDAVESVDWIEDAIVHKWLLTAKEYFFGRPDAMHEAEAVAAWAEDHTKLYSNEEQEELADTIAQFASVEVQKCLGKADPQDMDTLIGSLEDLGTRLGMGFENEIDDLFAAAEETRREMSREDEEGSGWYGRPSGISQTVQSIDWVFDALRE